MQSLNLNIIKCEILTGKGEDEIVLILDLSTSYPIMNYETNAHIFTQPG